jgi:hypothetical protein
MVEGGRRQLDEVVAVATWWREGGGGLRRGRVGEIGEETNEGERERERGET